MNLPANIQNLAQIIELARPSFTQLAKIHGAVTFEREASFAIQILLDNEYLAGVAAQNPDSLKYAVLNIASAGLSLNPMKPEVYLVPRKVNGRQKVCADISYFGYKKLAEDSGAIEWAQAEIVYKKDEFKKRSANEAPIHNFNAFGDRGEPNGVYCVAKLPSGDFITSTMTLVEVKEIASKSEAFKKGVGPWFGTDTEWREMVKKTMIRRARKDWPSGKDQPIEVRNLLELDSEANPAVIEAPKASEDQRAHSFAALRELLAKSGRTEKELLDYSVRAFKRDIESLDKLADLEILKLQTFLKSVAPKQVKAAQ